MTDSRADAGISDGGSLRTWELVAATALVLLFLIPLLMAGPFDAEDVQEVVFANQIHYQALLRGEWLFWLNNLGFGTPFPIGHRFDFNPLIALTAVVSLRTVLSALWIGHAVVMAVYFLRLAARSGITAPLRLVLLACYVFSASSVTYFYLTDWVTHIISWTLYPVLVFYLDQALRGRLGPNLWVRSARLALLFGLWLLNAHPGYAAPLLTVLVVYTIAAAPLRPRVYACLATGAVLCGIVVAERMYFTFSEMQLFPASVGFERGLHTPGDYLRAAFAPLVEFSSTLRLPFLGLVLTLAAVVSVVRLPRIRDRHTQGCIVAFAVAAGIGMLPRELSQWAAPSGNWLMRDPMVLFGTIAGGQLLQRGVADARLSIRGLTWLAVAVQLLQQGATTAWTGYQEWEDHRGQLQFYRHQWQPVGLGRSLVDHARTTGPRVYLSETVNTLMRGGLSSDGIHFSSDLVLLGLNPINGWFKAVSMDRVFPSQSMMEGRIDGQPDVIRNAGLLDVLGINMVMATEAEAASASGLPVLERTPVNSFMGQYDLVLLGNPDAWPIAVLVEPAVRELPLPFRPDCPHTGALCRDFDALLGKRLPDDVSVASTDGRYAFRFRPAAAERLLFVSVLHRPEWRAASPQGDLPIDTVADAFMVVPVPPGTEAIDIAFVPRVRIALTWLSTSALVVLLTVSGTAWWRGRGRTGCADSLDGQLRSSLGR